MANDTFATFQQISGLGFTDFLVGYRNISETRISFNDLGSSLSRFISGNNNNWDSAYSTLSANSASWAGGNSAYSTVNTNSASWEESADILPTVINYLSTTNILVSAITVNNLSALNITTTTVSARFLSAARIQLVHDTVNDGTNPLIFLGENDITGANGLLGLSGFNMFYDESINRLTLTSQFSTVSAPIFSVDRYGVANSPFLPYTFTFTPGITANLPIQVTTSIMTTPFLSGSIPYSEIRSRLGPGKGSVRISFLLNMGITTFNKALLFQLSPSPLFTTVTNVIEFSGTNPILGLNRSLNRMIEGFPISFNSIAFPSLTANQNGFANANDPQWYNYTDGNDLFFRIALSGGGTGWYFALSGGYVSIIP